MDKEISTHIHTKNCRKKPLQIWKWNRPSRRTKMSVKAAIRPSALPLPKTTSSQSLSSYDRKCMLPVAVDRNRRAGSDPRASAGSGHPSTPTRGSATSIVRSSSIRSTASNQDKRVIKESNKENSKAKEPAFNRSKIINNNNINTSKTKG